MKRTSLFAMGFLSMIAAVGALNVSDTFAAHPGRVDVIGSLEETVAQSDSVKPGNERPRVDVIETITTDGPAYPYTPSTSH